MPSVLGLVSLYFGMRWKSAAQENESLKQQLNSKKEALNTDFVDLFMTVLVAKEKPTQAELGEKMQQYNKEMILTGSNDVLQAYGDLMQSFYQDNNDPAEMLKLMGELMLAMRKELGHNKESNTLQWFDPMRPWLKDISTMMPEKHKKYRFLRNRLRQSK